MALGAALVGVAAACGSFSSNDDTTTPSNTPEAGTTDDANANPADAGSPVARTDAGPRFCDGAGAALFCDDFEGDPVFGFDGGVVTPDGVTNAGPGSDGGAGITAVIPATSGPAAPIFASRKLIIPGVSDLRIEADVLIDDYTAYADSLAFSNSLSLLVVKYGDSADSSNAPRGVALVAGSELQEGVDLTDDSTSEWGAYGGNTEQVTTGTWHHLRFDIGMSLQGGTNATGPGTVQWDGDGPLVAKENDGTGARPRTATPGANLITTLWFGAIRYNGNAIGADVTIHMDNVVVRSLP